MAYRSLASSFGGLEHDFEEWLEVDPRHSLRIWLRRFSAQSELKGAAVLFAGANSSGETFLVPEGGFTRHLVAAGWDVWLVDWRASPHVLGRILTKGPLGGSGRAERALFTIDEVAKTDIPLAIRRVQELRARDSRDTGRLGVLGHCLGGGSASVAIARGHLENLGITSFVLSTMALVYEAPWDGWVKAEDFLLERVLHADPERREISPHATDDWPPAVADAYGRWPRAWHQSDDTPEGRMLSALTFMFGKPYTFESLDPSLQSSVLLELFGPIHMGLFLHAGQNVRRGYSARFDEPDLIDRPRIVASAESRKCGAKPRNQAARPAVVTGDLDPTHFAGKRITLIGGSENRLWHRDSIDLMYEWLCSHVPGGTFGKHILSGYGMQEIYWAANARQAVYPLIEQSLE